jgi:hypothetical protein
MFGLFKSPSFQHATLGALQRKGGYWRGTISLGEQMVPLLIAGGKDQPDAEALTLAQALPAQYAGFKPLIEQALFEHYEPYGSDVESDVPKLGEASQVWPQVQLVHVLVDAVDKAMAVELGYTAVWDEEHTLGARFRDGKLLELNGSVVLP